MTQESKKALMFIREGVDTMMRNPDRFEVISKSYDLLIEAARYALVETDGEEYIEGSLLLDQYRIMKMICRLVEDIEMAEEDDHE